MLAFCKAVWRSLLPVCVAAIVVVPHTAAQAQGGSSPSKTITLDEYLNTTDITAAQLAPDGSAAIIGTNNPDWSHDCFRKNLWLWRRGSGPAVPLTTSGNDSEPQWSSDGKYIAFVSDRPTNGAEVKPSSDGKPADKTARIWILAANGGEAFPFYREPLDVHAFTWSKTGHQIFFSVMEPRSKKAEDAYKDEWKDVVQWRDKDRGDTLIALSVESALRANAAVPQAHSDPKVPVDKPAYPAESTVVAHSPLAIEEVVASPAGDKIAFETGPVAHRLENPADTELFVVPALGGQPTQVTHNQGSEGRLAWDSSGQAHLCSCPRRRRLH